MRLSYILVVTQNTRPRAREGTWGRNIFAWRHFGRVAVLGAVLHHACLSYRKIESFVDCFNEAIRDWFFRCYHLFEPDFRDRQAVTIDETNWYWRQGALWWPTVDCDMFEVLQRQGVSRPVQPRRLIFHKDICKRSRGRPTPMGDCVPRCDWPLEALDCDVGQETWGTRSLIEAWFGLLKYW